MELFTKVAVSFSSGRQCFSFRTQGGLKSALHVELSGDGTLGERQRHHLTRHLPHVLCQTSSKVHTEGYNVARGLLVLPLRGSALSLSRKNSQHLPTVGAVGESLERDDLRGYSHPCIRMMVPNASSCRSPGQRFNWRLRLTSPCRRLTMSNGITVFWYFSLNS